jgi:hypothetical protein
MAGFDRPSTPQTRSTRYRSTGGDKVSSSLQLGPEPFESPNPWMAGQAGHDAFTWRRIGSAHNRPV